MKTILTFAIGLLFVLNLNAQSPDAFKYQAVVRDASGNALTNSNTGVQIRILKTSASGTEVYKETHSTVSNDFGLINLEIGGGDNVVGVFEDIAWGTDSYFLEVGIDPAGGTSYSITGTTQLLSVPYALYAKNAGNSDDSFWFKDDNGIAYFTGVEEEDNVAIGNFAFNTAKFASYTVADDNQKVNIRAYSFDPNGLGFIQASNNQARNLSFGVNGTTNSGGANEAFFWYDFTADLKIGVDNSERMRIRTGTGNLDITTGDVYIKNETKGIIMKTPDGANCYRITIDNSGGFVSTLLASCPD